MFKKYFSLFLISFSFFFIQNCKKEISPPDNIPNPEIILSVAEEAGLREIYLRAEIKDITFPAEIQMLRNDSLIKNFEMISGDTTVIDTGLTPSTDYTYLANLFKDNILQDSSEILTTRTMDTTSHDFTWQTFTFGDGNGSYLRDVFIINENDIWAVGNIQVLDSTGTRYIPHNAVHWNGQEWELKQLMVKHPSWTEPHPISLDGIFAFSSTDIWFASGNVFHYDSANYNQSGLLTSYFLWDMGILNSDDGSATRIWGSNSNELIFVGSKGIIIHYNSSAWQKLEVPGGTDLHFEDIWGAWNIKSNKWERIAIASNKYTNSERLIVSINNNNVEILSDYDIQWPLSTVWFVPDRKYYVAGVGIYEKNVLSDTIWSDKYYNVTNYYTNSMRGNNINDIIAAGGFGQIVHFNGITWKNYTAVTGFNGNFGSVFIKDNLAVITGSTGVNAVLTMGIR